MKRKYWILLISLAVFLIISVITIGVLTNKLLDKKSNDAFYEVGELKVKSINEVTNTKLELVNFSYTNDAGITYRKCYRYEVSNIEITTMLAEYDEYLVLEMEFEEVDAFDLSQEEGSFALTKVMEDSADSCELTITYTQSTIEIIVGYTYIEN